MPTAATASRRPVGQIWPDRLSARGEAPAQGAAPRRQVFQRNPSPRLLARTASAPGLNIASSDGQPVSPGQSPRGPAIQHAYNAASRRSPRQYPSAAYASAAGNSLGSARSPSTSTSPAPTGRSPRNADPSLDPSLSSQLKYLEDENHALRERSVKCEASVADRRRQCDALREELWLLLDEQGKRASGEQRLRSSSRRLDLAKRQLEAQRQAAQRVERDQRDSVRRLEKQGEQLRAEMSGAQRDLEQLGQRGKYTQRELERLERDQAADSARHNNDELISALMRNSEQLRNEVWMLESESAAAEEVDAEDEERGRAELHSLREEMDESLREERKWNALHRPTDGSLANDAEKLALARMANHSLTDPSTLEVDRLQSEMVQIQEAFAYVEQEQVNKDLEAKRLERELRNILRGVLEKTAALERKSSELYAELRKLHQDAFLSDLENNSAKQQALQSNREAEQMEAAMKELSQQLTHETALAEEGKTRLYKARVTNDELWQELGECSAHSEDKAATLLHFPQEVELLNALEVLKRVHSESVAKGTRAERSLEAEVWRLELARQDLWRTCRNLERRSEKLQEQRNAEESREQGCSHDIAQRPGTGPLAKLPTVIEDEGDEGT